MQNWAGNSSKVCWKALLGWMPLYLPLSDSCLHHIGIEIRRSNLFDPYQLCSFPGWRLPFPKSIKHFLNKRKKWIYAPREGPSLKQKEAVGSEQGRITHFTIKKQTIGLHLISPKHVSFPWITYLRQYGQFYRSVEKKGIMVFTLYYELNILRSTLKKWSIITLLLPNQTKKTNPQNK